MCLCKASFWAYIQGWDRGRGWGSGGRYFNLREPLRVQAETHHNSLNSLHLYDTWQSCRHNRLLLYILFELIFFFFWGTDVELFLSGSHKKISESLESEEVSSEYSQTNEFWWEWTEQSNMFCIMADFKEIVKWTAPSLINAFSVSV